MTWKAIVYGVLCLMTTTHTLRSNDFEGSINIDNVVVASVLELYQLLEFVTTNERFRNDVVYVTPSFTLHVVLMWCLCVIYICMYIYI
jgi:hypothetical protein